MFMGYLPLFNHGHLLYDVCEWKKETVDDE